MIAKRLPPFRKTPGRPRLRYVAVAANVYLLQMEGIDDGRRELMDWLRIALDCEPTFPAIRPNYKREIILKRLQMRLPEPLSLSRQPPTQILSLGFILN